MEKNGKIIKMLKKIILTCQQHAKDPFSGQNTPEQINYFQSKKKYFLFFLNFEWSQFDHFGLGKSLFTFLSFSKSRS